MSKDGYLLDASVLFALVEDEHAHHVRVMRWFDDRNGAAWGTCAFSEAGFLRLSTNPRVGGHSFEAASSALAAISSLPGFRFWPIQREWAVLTEGMKARIFGHQQITDAYLLGVAVDAGGILVTLDRGIGFLAGRDFAKHLLVLQ